MIPGANPRSGSGSIDDRLRELVPVFLLEKARIKSGLEDSRASDLAVRETLRFIHLALRSDRELFFTGDRAVDSVWHFLITETRFYAGFCDRIRPGTFLHHSGIPYGDYCEGKSPQALLEEHGSWLASYVMNFGPIEEESLPFIPLAGALMRRFEVDLPGLNVLASNLIRASSGAPPRFDFEAFLARTGERANDLDADPFRLYEAIRELLTGFYREEHRPPGNRELIRIYTESTAMGFTLWQHLAALERLEGCGEWKARNPGAFERMASGEITVGLATTHLARENGSPLTGERAAGGWVVSGRIPWCSGHSFFDRLILGFESGEERMFALTAMPGEFRSNPGWKTSRTGLAAVDSSNTFSAEVADFFIPDAEVVQRFRKDRIPAGLATRFRLPGIGMALGALRETRARLRGGVLSAEIERALLSLELRAESLLEVIRDETVPLGDAHQIEKSRLIQDCTRLMVLVTGGAALERNSPVARRWMESMMPEIVIQAPAVLRGKISGLCAQLP